MTKCGGTRLFDTKGGEEDRRGGDTAEGSLRAQTSADGRKSRRSAATADICRCFPEVATISDASRSVTYAKSSKQALRRISMLFTI